MAYSPTSNDLSAGKILLVDPSLFTPTYDRALSDGLAANGADVSWAVRHPRAGDHEDDLAGYPEAYRFYKLSEGGNRGPGSMPGRILKGVEHWYGLEQLIKIARGYDVVHFQWAPVPILDAMAMRRIRKLTAVVLTVHDVVPLNGDKSGFQVQGFEQLFRAVDRLIVHTGRARDALITRGAPADLISVVPHGPLSFRCSPALAPAKDADRWTVVLFGRLKPYKGIDLLIEALGRLPLQQRDRLEVIVAGEPTFPLEPLYEQAKQFGLSEPTLTWLTRRLSDQDMADLLARADSFIFPYRTIDASGVLFLVAGLRKWMIASPLGAFIDLIGDSNQVGALVDPEDPKALGRALVDSIGRAPAEGAFAVPSWESIGNDTLAAYRAAIKARAEA